VIWLALLVGYLIGSTPTAGWIGRLYGVDLRTEGSGNPGANNARVLGGMRLAATVLVVEIAKGAVAVLLGISIGGSLGGLFAGLAALAGNVANVWYRFSGGQGLGISAGILLAAWPWFLPVVVGVIGSTAYFTRSSARAAIAAGVALIAGAIISVVSGYPEGWGIGDPEVAALAVGMIAIVTPKQIGKLRSRTAASEDPTA
jgi:glycerol-3-phosphate acyltransferase PlsY